MQVKLNESDKVKIGNAADIYRIMRKILMRENEIDRDREHFWVISLNNANKILNIELVSFGSVNSTVVMPMEVISIPLQKRAVKMALVHNHPSGELTPSDNDIDLTDRLYQVGRIMHVPVIDHLIISEEGYYSFKKSGLLDEISKSVKYVPMYEIKERMEKAEQKARRDEKREIARAMKKAGYPIEGIVEITGLSKSSIYRLKI